jgi:hypothetical protein
MARRVIPEADGIAIHLAALHLAMAKPRIYFGISFFFKTFTAARGVIIS